ncbi:MAG TPA: cytochrome P450 [Ktedonobacteraceae bacterium]
MLKSAQSPTTKTVPFISKTPSLTSLRAFMQDRLGFLEQLARTGDVCGFYMGPTPILFFNKPEHVQAILVEGAYAFSKGKLMHKAIKSNGLFMSEGDFHRHQRKLIAPMFQPRHISSYVETIVQYGELLARSWGAQTVIDLNQEMINLTMSIIGKVLFDIDMLKETDELGAAMATGFEHTVRRLSEPLLPPDNWPTPHNHRVRAATALLENRVLQMIAERREQQAQGLAKRVDMLSVLLNAQDENGQHMSERQILDECIILLGAGHETTAAALAWSWYFLCQHPEIYTQVQQEVQQALQGQRATVASLAQLPLCLQVFKETMRLYPPAAAILRESLEATSLDGYRVPKGANILISPYTLHRRPENFPQPEIFDPTRFSPEREKQLPRHAYLPFGAGARVCIGNHLALMEGQLLIATIVQQASLSLVPGQQIVPDPVHNLALRPGGKVNVIVSHA